MPALDLKMLRRRLIDHENVAVQFDPRDGINSHVLLDSECRAIIAALEDGEALKAEVRRLPLTPYTNYLDQRLLIGADEATVSEEDVPLTAALLRDASRG